MDTEYEFIIYAPSEGYWSNEWGWVESAFDATKFTWDEQLTLNLPLSADNDARWSHISQFFD